MYVFNYEINLANVGVILTLILVLIELRGVRKMRKAFEHMFGLF